MTQLKSNPDRDLPVARISVRPVDAITVAISGPEVVASQTTDSLGKYS